MPLDRAVMDFHKVGLVDTAEGQRLRVIVVVTEREGVDVLLDTLRRAGLKPEGIDLSVFSVIRSLNHHVAEHRRPGPVRAAGRSRQHRHRRGWRVPLHAAGAAGPGDGAGTARREPRDPGRGGLPAAARRRWRLSLVDGRRHRRGRPAQAGRAGARIRAACRGRVLLDPVRVRDRHQLVWSRARWPRSPDSSRRCRRRRALRSPVARSSPAAPTPSATSTPASRRWPPAWQWERWRHERRQPHPGRSPQAQRQRLRESVDARASSAAWSSSSSPRSCTCSPSTTSGHARASSPVYRQRRQLAGRRQQLCVLRHGRPAAEAAADRHPPARHGPVPVVGAPQPDRRSDARDAALSSLQAHRPGRRRCRRSHAGTPRRPRPPRPPSPSRSRAVPRPKSAVAATMVALGRVQGVSSVALASHERAARLASSSSSSGSSASGGCPFPVTFSLSLLLASPSSTATASAAPTPSDVDDARGHPRRDGRPPRPQERPMTLRKRDRIVLAIVAAVRAGRRALHAGPQARAPEGRARSRRRSPPSSSPSRRLSRATTIGRAAQAALKTDGAQWAALKLAVPGSPTSPRCCGRWRRAPLRTTSR